jgi:5,10-methenyltetrahydrofolate synthetase
LRTRLLAEREAFVSRPGLQAAEDALAGALREVLHRLEPDCLGCYWPHRGEFNAHLRKLPLALPFARRAPPTLEYRHWSGGAANAVDECGLPSTDGSPVVPDVVLVPCVGYTESGHRLGYGGGYFDRWLAEHMHVCAVGVAWSFARLEEAALGPQPHDVPLALVVTELGAT